MPTTLLQDTVATAIKRRARSEYGDYEEMVVEDRELDGFTRIVDLADDVIEPNGLIVMKDNVPLVAGTDYILDSRGGKIVLTTMPPAGTMITVTGKNYQFYNDDELNDFLHSAVLKHTHQRVVSGRSRDYNGFIAYSHMKQTLATLPEIEHHPVAVFTAVEALWTLLGDAAYDINADTADGTSLPRMQRYQSIMNQVETMTERYKELCFAIGGVGFWRIHDGGKLRRVSQSTGRLIPLIAPREVDDGSYARRIITPLDVPEGTLTNSNPIPCVEYNPTALASAAWCSTIEITGVPLTNPAYVVTASISAGSRLSALVPVTALVVDDTHVKLSLTQPQVAALPPYAPWRVMVTYPGGNAIPAVSGTFLVEYPD